MKNERTTAIIVEERREQALGFVGREKLLQAKCGGVPKNPKTSAIYTHRPGIPCIDAERREEFKTAYFDKYFTYKEVSRQYREGKYWLEFPEGMYPHPYATQFPDHHPLSSSTFRFKHALPYRFFNRHSPPLPITGFAPHFEREIASEIFILPSQFFKTSKV